MRATLRGQRGQLPSFSWRIKKGGLARYTKNLQVPRLPLPAVAPGAGLPQDRGVLAHPRGAPLLRRRLPGM